MVLGPRKIYVSLGIWIENVSLEVGREVGPSGANLGVTCIELVVKQRGPRRGAKGRCRGLETDP